MQPTAEPRNYPANPNKNRPFLKKQDVVVQLFSKTKNKFDENNVVIGKSHLFGGGFFGLPPAPKWCSVKA